MLSESYTRYARLVKIVFSLGRRTREFRIGVPSCACHPRRFTAVSGDRAQSYRAGVEYYHVDYIQLQVTFYGANGAIVAPLNLDGLPAVARDFDMAALRQAILDSQQKSQTYREFSQRAMRAGVQGYVVFLQGARVTYLGRQGDQHTEWFPGAEPNVAARA